jgi:hypothetical protein
MATRGATDAQRAQRVRIGRATGSHSVDRIVSHYLFQANRHYGKAFLLA